MTTRQLLEWYNHERPQLSPTNTKGAQHGSTMHSVSGVLRSSILFEAVDKEDERTMIWGARPLDVVVDRAIASRRQLKKFPHFLQEAITEKLQEESE